MKRALVICGDAWHPAEIVRRGLASLCPEGFEFEFVEGDVNDLVARLAYFSVVVLARSNLISATDQRPWLTLDSAAALRDHLRRGKGLMAIHAGTARYELTAGMKELIGGVFERHPEPCAVTMEPGAGHPLTAGVEQFVVQDEHYFMTMSDESVDVFLHSRSEHGLQPAGWTRTIDGGRVCVLTPGHNLEIWLHPEFQKLLLNGMNWLMKAI